MPLSLKRGPASLIILLLLVALAAGAAGCSEARSSVPPLAGEGEGQVGEEIEPPFDVSGEARDLLLVWFDGEGAHTAESREQIPEAHRDRVRVDSLRLAPDQRDPDHVYVADMRREVHGRYPVRRHPREAFDRMVEAAGATARTERELAAGGAPAGGAAAGDSDVIIYGASWCSACRATARFLRERQIPFVERDIEREPGARAEMMRRAQAAGVRPSGIPVIDFRGQIITGFNQPALERAIRASQVQI